MNLTIKKIMKKTVLFAMILGSVAGGYIPLLWGGSVFSAASVLIAAVGGFAGIWIGYKIGSRMF